jgi:hypothetical protein
MTVTEVGGDEPEAVVDQMGIGTNENANWVNAPGELQVRGIERMFGLTHKVHGSFIRSSFFWAKYLWELYQA